MANEELTEVSVCIGTFDPNGIPISIAKHLSDCATVAFQSITLNLLIARSLSTEPADLTYIHSKDGAIIRIERNAKGFVGYLGTSK